MPLDRHDPPTRRPLRRAAPWLALLSVAALGGCGGGGGGSAMSDADQIRANLSRYGNAVLDGDGKTACALIVEANRRAIARTMPGGTCPEVIGQFQALRSGDPKRICAMNGILDAMPEGTSVDDCVRQLESEPQVLEQMTSGFKELDTTLRDAGSRLSGLRVTGDTAQGRVTLSGTPEKITFTRVDGTWLVSSPEALTDSGS